MAYGTIGGGRQVGDGNLSEVVLGACTPVAVTADTTLTVAQLAAQVISCNKGSDAGLTVTTPTAAAIDAALGQAKVYSSFDLSINNANNSGASSTVTFAGGTGVTVVGSPTVARYGSNTYRLVKTGTAAWSAYNIA